MTGSFVIRTAEEQEAYRIDSIAATDDAFDFYALDYVDRHTRMIVFGMINRAFSHGMDSLAFADGMKGVQEALADILQIDTSKFIRMEDTFTIH